MTVAQFAYESHCLYSTFSSTLFIIAYQVAKVKSSRLFRFYQEFMQKEKKKDPSEEASRLFVLPLQPKEEIFKQKRNSNIVNEPLEVQALGN